MKIEMYRKIKKFMESGVLYTWYGKLKSSKIVVTLLVLGFGFYYLWELTFSGKVESEVQQIAIPVVVGIFSTLIGYFFKLRKDDKELIVKNGNTDIYKNDKK